MDRRGFIRNAGAALGGAGLLSMLPRSLVEAMAAPAPSGGLANIEHVVILMQENRSFDHYFGALRGVRGFGDLNAAQLPTGRSVFHQPRGDGYVLPYATRLQNLAGLDHTVDGGHAAWAGGRYDGWIEAKSELTMAHYGREDLGFYHQLADAFTICDAYHCSVMGPTDPNRMFLFTGKIGNPVSLYNFESTIRSLLLGNDVGLGLLKTFGTDAVVDAIAAAMQGAATILPVEIASAIYRCFTGSGELSPFAWKVIKDPAFSANVKEALLGYQWTTYAERLEEQGVSWRVYQEWDNYADNSLEYFARFQQVAEAALKYTSDTLPYRSFEHFYTDVRTKPAKRATLLAKLARGVDRLSPRDRSLFERGLYRAPDGDLVGQFRSDATAGRLPRVSWIVLPYAQSEHPIHGPRNGAAVVHDVLDVIGSVPGVWNKTVFILNYDENDGYFDHVLPPVPPVSASGESYYGEPFGLGARVPMIVVSPWSKQGVCSELSEHSSVLRFLEKVTGVAEPNIGDWRRRMTGDLTSAFDFSTTTAPVLPPAEPAAPQPATGAREPVPENQEMPVQEPGTKPKRPLSYAPITSVRQDVAARKVVLSMRNAAAAGAPGIHYIVYPNAFRDANPTRFDVLPGGTVTETIEQASGKYDCTCYGPNGFQHRFAGDLTQPGATAEVSAGPAPGHGRAVTLSFANGGSTAVVFTVKANAYRTDGPWTFPVPPGNSASVNLPLETPETGDGWYDLTATVDTDSGYLRRFRGYVENGSTGVTADDSAPFDRLILDRTIYEQGRDLVVSVAAARREGQRQVVVHLIGPSAPDSPVRETALPERAAQVVVPAEDSTGRPLAPGDYEVRQLDAFGKTVGQPARFRIAASHDQNPSTPTGKSAKVPAETSRQR
ncbi:alkaline phosphatase family protein [Amycolatopsis circi]|uniref:alkaline phosphatase family protein n=1 Tax=Amycolatopsis circi TaxID=871959 RepID=UPI000E240364|nr:alkaline phosphatase family protein [Amycolatopsis circi]